MRRKIIGIIISMLIILNTVPFVNATVEKNDETTTKSGKIQKILGDKQAFINCYIDASGEIDFTFQIIDIPIGLQRELILYWPIIFIEPDVDVTIYSKKNGEILWQDNIDSGQWNLYLFVFRGIYNNNGSTIEKLIANLEGKALMVIVSNGQ